MYYYCKWGNKTFYPKYQNYSNQNVDSLFGVISMSRIVIFDLLLENVEINNLQFYISINGFSCEIFPIPRLSIQI